MAPRQLSYLITTVFAGNFLLSIHELTHSHRYLEAAKSVAMWIIKENGVVEEDAVWFYYANHPLFRHPVVNVISMASGFLSRLYLQCSREVFKRLAQESLRYVLKCQNPNGSWHYSSKRVGCTDNVHTGFTIEGLCDVLEAFPSGKLYESLMAAARFYWGRLYESSGYGVEETYSRSKLLITLEGLLRSGRPPGWTWLLRSLKARALSLSRPTETRLYGYASGIRAFTQVSELLRVYNWGLRIARYVIARLQREDGAFCYRSNDKSVYIRHEAHIFDAFASLLLSLKRRGEIGVDANTLQKWSRVDQA